MVRNVLGYEQRLVPSTFPQHSGNSLLSELHVRLEPEPLVFSMQWTTVSCTQFGRMLEVNVFLSKCSV